MNNVTDKLYRKSKGRYRLVGYDFAGFPANGVWVVEDGKKNCVYQFKGVPEKPSPALISYLQYQQELQEKISSEWNQKALSVADISKIACEFFALKAGAMKAGKEIIEN